MKLALADRDVYYADPLFVDVPLTELLSQSIRPCDGRLLTCNMPRWSSVRATRAMARHSSNRL